MPVIGISHIRFCYLECNVRISASALIAIFLAKMRCSFDIGAYSISSFKLGGVYFILGLLGTAFISNIKIEENEIMCQNNKIFLKPCSVKLLNKECKI